MAAIKYAHFNEVALCEKSAVCLAATPAQIRLDIPASTFYGNYSIRC